MVMFWGNKNHSGRNFGTLSGLNSQVPIEPIFYYVFLRMVIFNQFFAEK